MTPTRSARRGRRWRTGASALLDELRLSLDFYGAQEAAVPVERVVLCGPGSAIPGLAERMEPVLGLPIAIGRPEALGRPRRRRGRPPHPALRTRPGALTMRPVNLIPPEEQPGERKPMRGGPLAYIVVGALAAAVIGVTVLAVTNNQISESKAEITRLEGEKATVEARAQALDAYTQFHTLREQRDLTVASLADSRFDWQRVMRELAIVLPGNVWLTTLSGTASPSVSVDGGGSAPLRSSVPGPALELNGCATGQDAVAGFVQALKQIDGVTRVGVESSKLGEESGAGGSASGGGGNDCQTRSFIAQFQMVVAFDAAPVYSEDANGEAATAPEPSAEPTAASSESEGN